MAVSNNHIDKAFRAKLKNFSQAAPPDVWEGVSDVLMQERHKNRLLLMVRIAASVAIIVTLGTAYLLLRNPADRVRQAGELVTIPSDTSQSLVLGEGQKGSVPEKTAGTGNEQERQGVSEGRQVLVSEAGTGARKGKDLHPGDDGSRQTVQDDLALQATNLAGQTQVPEYSQAVIYANQKEDVDFIAATGINDQKHIDAIPVPEDSYGLDRINALRQMPEPGVNVSAAGSGSNTIVLIDESADNLVARKDRWAVGTQVSPVYSYRDAGSSDAQMYALSDYNVTESGMMAYTGGVNLSYLPAQRLTIQSGLYYSRIGISIDHSFVTTNMTQENTYTDAFKYNTISNSSGVIRTGSGNIEPYYTSGWPSDRNTLDWGEGTESTSFNPLTLKANKGEIIQNFEYLEIPVILKYRMIDRRLGFNILGGMSTNLLLGSDAYLSEAGNREKIGQTADLKPVSYSSTIGMGMEYALSSRFNLNFEPFFKYYLTSINQSSAITSRPYTFGVFSGISFIF
jgi:hypothetical protein